MGSNVCLAPRLELRPARALPCRDPHDSRPTRELVREFSWMRERVLQIRLPLLGEGRPLVPVGTYLPLIEAVDLSSV